MDLMDEVVAGLLWMHLKVPQDASRDEVQDQAHDLVRRIRAGAPQSAIADCLRSLQLDWLCEFPNMPAIRELAQRVMGVVRPSGTSLQSAA